MRHLHSESHFRHALFAVQEAEGYVDALLEMARDQIAGRRFSLGYSTASLRLDARRGSRRSRAHTH
jgi:hypothetical protein